LPRAPFAYSASGEHLGSKIEEGNQVW